MTKLLTTMTALCIAYALNATLASPVNVFSDTSETPRYEAELVPRLAFTQGWRSMFNPEAALRISPATPGVFKSHTIAAGAEWNYSFNKYLVGYKIGYTYLDEIFDYSGISAGCAAVYFTDRSSFGWYIQPQLAFEGLELFELMVQYNIPVNAPGIDYRVNRFSAGLRLWWR